jgi:hypothetical protein
MCTSSLDEDDSLAFTTPADSSPLPSDLIEIKRFLSSLTLSSNDGADVLLVTSMPQSTEDPADDILSTLMSSSIPLDPSKKSVSFELFFSMYISLTGDLVLWLLEADLELLLLADLAFPLLSDLVLLLLIDFAIASSIDELS